MSDPKTGGKMAGYSAIQDLDELHGMGLAELREFALRSVARHRLAHPEWTVADLFREIGMPPSPLGDDLAIAAGFRPDAVRDLDDIARVSVLSSRGIWSPDIIAQEVGLSPNRVKEILANQPAGYGLASYGSSPYGTGRQVSDGTNPVRRRVTVVGQMSYRGHLYTLGAPYRGRIASLIERGSMIEVSFGDRPTLRLTSRHHEMASDRRSLESRVAIRNRPQ